MAGERTFAILPCTALDAVLPFYEVLGFAVTYRQERPNPYAVVGLEDISLHFAAVPGFEPEHSYASVIVVVPDAEGLYRTWAARLREHFGGVPASGIPRVLRPRRKRGTVAGFSVVDPGGNWLRVSRAGDAEDAAPPARGLALVVRAAARLGDAKGDDAAAAAMLDAGLARHAGAPPAERLPALVYRAELAVRLDDEPRARELLTEVGTLPLDQGAREALAEDLAAAAELARVLGLSPPGIARPPAASPRRTR